MKNGIKKMLGLFGYEITKKTRMNPPEKQLQKIKTGSPDLFFAGLKNREFDIKNIIDVGANSGGWAKLAHKFYPEAHIHMIEPQVEMKNALDELCASNPKLSWTMAGAGEKDEKLILTVWDDLQGSGFVTKPDDNLISTGKQRYMDVVSIDNLIKKGIPIPDLIKIDVQGFEKQVLNGASSVFGKTELFILETSFFAYANGAFPIFPEIVAYMFERGYTVYDFVSFNRRPLDNALGQCDLCFARIDGTLRKSNKWSL